MALNSIGATRVETSYRRQKHKKVAECKNKYNVMMFLAHVLRLKIYLIACIRTRQYGLEKRTGWKKKIQTMEYVNIHLFEKTRHIF